MSRWRRSDYVLCLLAPLAILAAWIGFLVGNGPSTHGCGGCFSQWYVAGTLVRSGQADRLYDQSYFRQLQQSMRDHPLYSSYPPTMGLLVSPLANLSYRQAMAVWYLIQVLSILATGTIFYRTAPFPRPWRINMLLALASLVPLWIAVGVGQISPLLLLIVTCGLTLHRREYYAGSGLVLSLLALKPHWAAGLVLWMVLRRDFRTLTGLAAGFAIQALAVAALLGPGVWLDYLQAMPTIFAVNRYPINPYPPLVEASFAGIAGNLVTSAGLTAWKSTVMSITYVATAGAAVILLARVVLARRPWRWARPPCPAPESANYEYACGILFMTIFPPYLIVYDQTLLAIALAMLWSSPAWRWGIALFITMTAPVDNLAVAAALGFNLTGLVALAAMFSLAFLSFSRSCPKVSETVSKPGLANRLIVH